MGDIQRSHETNENYLVTNTAGLGDGGSTTVCNQDEKYIVDCTIADNECDYSPLMDSVEAHKRNIPFTYMDAAPDGARTTPLVAEDPDENAQGVERY